MTTITIDKTLKTPIHRQLSTCIEAAIHSGLLKPGELLPSEDQLGRTFNISRTVVRRAFLDLTQRQLIDQRQGQGHFVRQVRAYPGLLSNPHAYTQAYSQTIQTMTILKEFVSSKEELLSQMGFSQSDLHLRLKRIHQQSQEILFEEEWILKCESSLGAYEDVMIASSLSAPNTITQSLLEIQLISNEEAALLNQSKNSPCFVFTQKIVNPEGVLIAHYKAVIPSSITQLTVTVSNP